MEKRSYLLFREKIVCANTRIVIPENDFIDPVREGRIVYTRNTPISIHTGNLTSLRGSINHVSNKFISNNRNIVKGKSIERFGHHYNTLYRLSPIAPKRMIFPNSIDILSDIKRRL